MQNLNTRVREYWQQHNQAASTGDLFKTQGQVQNLRLHNLSTSFEQIKEQVIHSARAADNQAMAN